MKTKRKGNRNEHRTMALLEAAPATIAPAPVAVSACSMSWALEAVTLSWCKSRRGTGPVQLKWSSWGIFHARLIAAAWFIAGGIECGCRTWRCYQG